MESVEGKHCGLCIGSVRSGRVVFGYEGFEVIVTSQIDSFRASMRTVVLIRVILELILRV